MCNKYKNVYTCFSSCNDGETLDARLIQNKLISDILNKYISKYPNITKKIMMKITKFSPLFAVT